VKHKSINLLSLLGLTATILGAPLACGGGAETPTLFEPQLSAVELGQDVVRWESRMLEKGASLCQKLRKLSPKSEQALSEVYYDAVWVFWQIADYTADPTWQDCASLARTVYRDQYVVPNDGKVPGYWNFSHGLAEDYLRTNDSRSKDALKSLISNAAFSRLSTPLEETKDSELSREVAYAMMGYLNGSKIGLPLPERFFTLREQAFGHLAQWFETSTAKTLKPFMVALTAQALIEAHESHPEARTVKALSTALEELWKRTWIPSARAFQYQANNPSEEDKKPAPDLNLLIAPAYLWIYQQTQNKTFLERAQEIFAGGVNKAFLENGKQFNQNYRWSFSYVRRLSEISHEKSQ
jgi:hypothetical protein